MSPEDQQMFDDYFDLFSRPGWAELEKDLSTNIQSTETIYNVKDLESLWHTKGKLEALNYLATFRETVTLLYEERNRSD